MIKRGDKAVLADEVVLESDDEGVVCLKKALENGPLTVENRWRHGCDALYWVAFEETGSFAYSERLFKTMEVKSEVS